MSIRHIDPAQDPAALPLEDNIYDRPELYPEASTGILLSTLWSQSGVISIGNNTSVTYNEYTPLDTRTSTHSLTGCTNTAAAQIIYYFIENSGLELALTLNADDEYTSSYNGLTINVKADGSTPGTLSFAEINSYLSGYKLNSAAHAAALLYACGVVQEANYSSSATGTAWWTDVFYRSGLQSANNFYAGRNSTTYYWGTTDASGNFTISDAGFEVIIENLQAGHPVGTSYPGHALVIDGYNDRSDTFHINFGWGDSSSTRWYTREEMTKEGYYEFIYDIFTERIETLTVSDSRVYGTGTMVRAFEQAWSIKGSNTVKFSASVANAAVQLTDYIEMRETTTVQNFNMTVSVTDTGYFSWGAAFYGDEKSSTTFTDFSGALIVNTGAGTNVAMYFGEAAQLSISANNTLIYGGSYSVSGNYSSGAAAVLSAMRTARDQGNAPDAFVLNAADKSIYGSDGNDSITFAGSSLVVGGIDLRSGADSLTVADGSRLYGDIRGSGGSNTITVDSTGAIDGNLYAAANLRFVLNSAAQSHALFTIESNVSNISTNASVSVDIAEAEVGTYILFAAASGAANYNLLNSINLTITGSGQPDYILSGNGTSTSTFADVILENRMLKLNINALPSLPTVLSVSADITAPTNRNVTVSATFNDYVLTAQYSTDNRTWETYTSGVVMTDNGTVYFRGIGEGGKISGVKSFTVANIDKIAPDAPTAKANITAPTDKNVTVIATFSSDSKVREYSLDGENWSHYTSGVVMTDNGTIYFRGIDAAGNISEIAEYTVNNIIGGSLAKPTAQANTTAPTNQNVTVTATFSSSAKYKEYSLDGENWSTYSASGVVMTDNGTVYFRGIDEEGNVSPVASYTVTNIDRTAPEAPTVKASTTELTNRNVIVSAAFSDDSAQKQYSTDNQNWKTYTASLSVSANGTYYFRGIDAAGNISEVTSIDITNIDKTVPNAPIVKASTTVATNKDVTITATFSSDSVQKQYSTDNKNWQEYTKAVTVAENGTYYFRGINATGKASGVSSINITNIDKLPPEAPTVKANITGPTNRDVTVSAVFSDDSRMKQYSLDGKTWRNYMGGVTLHSNGTVFFRGVDAAGNASKTVSYAVTNIDKLPPEAPTVKASITEPTNRDVTVSAAFGSDSSKKQYSTDNINWQNYTRPLTAKANGTYYFRGIDAAGNASETVSYAVTNIDKVAPNAPTVKASTTEPTHQDVTLTATFGSDSSKKQYSTDKKNWKEYTKAVTASANGTYYFRGIDAAGNISQVESIQVLNIRKNAPAVAASTTKPTNQNVTITATFSNDSVKNQYSTNNRSWKSYKKAITVKSNGTYYFRSIDAAGDISRITSITVSNIDKKKPDAPTVSVSTVKPTNENVTVTAAFSSDSSKKQYSTDKKTWKTYDQALSVGANGTYYFRGIDAAGNISKIRSVKIKNIDKTAPDAPKLKLSTVKVTVKPVTIKATFGKGSKIKEYSVDGKKWLTLSKSLKVSANGTYYFRSTDAAGNVSKVSSIKVNNIASADISNNSWIGATKLAGTVLGALDTKADPVDYYDVGDVAKLMLDMEAGKAKVTFCGSDKRAVATKVRYADGSVATLSSLDLASGSKRSDNITLADLGDAVKYLKIENAAKGSGCYRLAQLA